MACAASSTSRLTCGKGFTFWCVFVLFYSIVSLFLPSTHSLGIPCVPLLFPALRCTCALSVHDLLFRVSTRIAHLRWRVMPTVSSVLRPAPCALRTRARRYV
ncbi:hypothetical protein B0H16DRAFT_1625015 [Mycena metata]|uniref:Uncharacterized protein n=1 Tax=Mycena metata TaxID=1033252 RepID=A0AAD7MDS8_9AGAR|nr:hypothetical protein B0H16DRAFT_1625015 [Mycena metata]